MAPAAMGGSGLIIPYGGNLSGFMPSRMGERGSGLSFSSRNSSMIGDPRSPFRLSPMNAGMPMSSLSFGKSRGYGAGGRCSRPQSAAERAERWTQAGRASCRLILDIPSTSRRVCSRYRRQRWECRQCDDAVLSEARPGLRLAGLETGWSFRAAMLGARALSSSLMCLPTARSRPASALPSSAETWAIWSCTWSTSLKAESTVA